MTPRGLGRRSFLSGLAGVTAGLAGCLAGGAGVTESSVTHAEIRRNREQRPTIVEFDDDAGVVRVLGYMYYGSSSCNRVGIASTRYDDAADHLTVVLESQSTNPLPLACTADLAATWYRAEIQIAGGLPETVTVTERRGDDTETRTVDRSEQRALCTTEHPPDSPEAEKAHWTCPERYVAVSESG